jgi:hypothetical protein
MRVLHSPCVVLENGKGQANCKRVVQKRHVQWWTVMKQNVMSNWRDLAEISKKLNNVEPAEKDG